MYICVYVYIIHTYMYIQAASANAATDASEEACIFIYTQAKRQKIFLS